MQRVLLVGKGSFIAQHFIEMHGSDFSLDAVSHAQIDSIDLRGYDCVVNMAYHPSYFTAAYSEEIDFSLKLARIVATQSGHFVLMSSRKVYGTRAPFPVSEADSLDAEDFYGSNNAITEGKVMELLGDRCTVLRAANVFGYEPGRHTFFGIAMTKLLEQERLVFNFSAFTPRDFLPVERFSHVLAEMIKISPAGIFNVGSGVALPVGQVALWIIEGYGCGEVLITKPHEFDRFLLDITKLEAVLGPQPDLTEMIYQSSVRIGQKIREYKRSALSLVAVEALS